MASSEYDVTLSGGLNRTGNKIFDADRAHYISEEFTKVRSPKDLESRGYYLPENPDDREYIVERRVIKDVPTIRVLVLYEHKSRREFMDLIRAMGNEPDPYARTVWGNDPEMTKKFLEQCNYLHPIKPTIVLLPNGKFKCCAEYIIDNKRITFRLDEIERRPTNIELDPATYEKSILEQLAASHNGRIKESKITRLSRK